MEKTVRFFRESMSNRLNDDESAIIVCMQRLRDNDVSGDILAREVDYCHLMTQSPVPRKGGIIKREYWRGGAGTSKRKARPSCRTCPGRHPGDPSRGQQANIGVVEEKPGQARFAASRPADEPHSLTRSQVARWQRGEFKAWSQAEMHTSRR
jgi:hypothetical protein